MVIYFILIRFFFCHLKKSNSKNQKNTNKNSESIATLSSISVSNVIWQSSFSQGVTMYHVTAPRGLQIVEIQTTPVINGITVSVNGITSTGLVSVNISSNNMVTITTIALDGVTTMTYTIAIQILCNNFFKKETK